MSSGKRLRACERCGWIHGASQVVAVGRFKPGGPDGYRVASDPSAPLRDSRAEAMRDVCNAFLARGR